MLNGFSRPDVAEIAGKLAIGNFACCHWPLAMFLVGPAAIRLRQKGVFLVLAALGGVVGVMVVFSFNLSVFTLAYGL